MGQTENELLLRITRNPRPQKVFDFLEKIPEARDSYSKIVVGQIRAGIKFMHLPEPWSGHLSRATVLFVGSNPSFDPNEKFPINNKCKWPDKKIINFFDNRFKNAQTVTGFKPSRYWIAIAKYTRWLLEDEHPNIKGMSDLVVLDEYACLTEVVHCKSRHEEGVQDCIKEEAKFTQEIIECFTTCASNDKNNMSHRYIVLVGQQAKKVYKRGDLKISSKNLILHLRFVPHPSSHVADEKRKETISKDIPLK